MAVVAAAGVEAEAAEGIKEEAGEVEEEEDAAAGATIILAGVGEGACGASVCIVLPARLSFSLPSSLYV